MSSSILWQNDAKTVVLLDLPRSIEEAQVPSGGRSAAAADGNRRKLRRLVSALPPASPFLTPEPKAGGSGLPALSPSAQVAELMTQAAVESALEEITKSYDGPWCLPRIYSDQAAHSTQSARAPSPTPALPAASSTSGAPDAEPSDPHPSSRSEEHPLIPVPNSTLPPSPDPTTTPTTTTPIPHPPPSNHPPQHHHHHLPPNSHPLPGLLTTTRPTFLHTTHPNQFHLILLDPPWPNRSAKRKRTGAGAYHAAASLISIHTLLSQVPVASRLAPGGLVGVWVTNAARFSELLVKTVFGEWDVEVVGEWTWLKVTSGGEPVVGFGAGWRRPWERLVLARRRGGPGGGGGGRVGGKVVVSVPDVHSRKPNLRGLFEEGGLVPGEYEALEVFARNLTAGWWAWGDEVLKFQGRECWVDVDEDGEGGGP